MSLSPGIASSGHIEIRDAIEKMLAANNTLSDEEQRETIVVGNLVLTSASLGETSFTAEVAQRQPDGSWLWVLDHPNFTSADYSAWE